MTTIEKLYILTLMEYSLVYEPSKVYRRWSYCSLCDWLESNSNLFSYSKDLEKYSRIHAMKNLLWDSFLQLYPEKESIAKKAGYWFPIGLSDGRLTVVVHAIKKLNNADS